MTNFENVLLSKSNYFEEKKKERKKYKHLSNSIKPPIKKNLTRVGFNHNHATIAFDFDWFDWFWFDLNDFIWFDLNEINWFNWFENQLLVHFFLKIIIISRLNELLVVLKINPKSIELPSLRCAIEKISTRPTKLAWWFVEQVEQRCESKRKASESVNNTKFSLREKRILNKIKWI